MNLISLMPPSWRYWLYATYGAASLAFGAIAAYCAAVPNLATPTWVIGGLAALGWLGSAIGLVAAGNTDRNQPAEPADADGEDLMPALAEDGDQ